MPSDRRQRRIVRRGPYSLSFLRQIAPLAGAVASGAVKNYAVKAITSAGRKAGRYAKNYFKRRRAKKATTPPTKRRRVGGVNQQKFIQTKTFRDKVKKIVDGQKSLGTYKSKTFGVTSIPSSHNVQECNGNFINHGIASGGTRMEFFDINSIVDAASILYNGKLAAMDWQTDPDDLNFPFNKLRVDVPYMSYSIEMTNTFDQSILVSIIHYRAKKSVPTDDFQSEFGTAISNSNLVGETLPSPLNIQTYGLRPQQFDYMRKLFEMTETNRRLMPGESYSVSYSKSNQTYDIAKYLEGDEVPRYTKGHEGLFLIVSHPLTTHQTQDINTTVTTYPTAGHFAGLDARANDAIAIQVTRTFKINCPDLAEDDKDVDAFCYKIYSDETPYVTGSANQTFEEKYMGQLTVVPKACHQ